MLNSLNRRLPVVVLVAGHAGTGKTRFSKQLMARAAALQRPMVFLDKDTIGGLFSQALMQLHTGDPHDRDSEIFQLHVRELEYRALLDVALDNIELGVDCILCAPFGRECKTLESYTAFVEQTFAGKAIPFLVWAHVEPEEAHRRIAQRQHPMDAYKLRHWDTYLLRRYRPDWISTEEGHIRWLESGSTNDNVLEWLSTRLWNGKSGPMNVQDGAARTFSSLSIQ